MRAGECPSARLREATLRTAEQWASKRNGRGVSEASRHVVTQEYDVRISKSKNCLGLQLHTWYRMKHWQLSPIPDTLQEHTPQNI